jgi:hypothetical protein
VSGAVQDMSREVYKIYYAMSVVPGLEWRSPLFSQEMDVLSWVITTRAATPSVKERFRLAMESQDVDMLRDLIYATIHGHICPGIHEDVGSFWAIFDEVVYSLGTFDTPADIS